MCRLGLPGPPFPNAPSASGTVPSVIGDLDGDGRLDLVTTNYGTHNISVFLNQGGGLFDKRTDYSTNLEPAGVAMGDVDHDGDLDLVVEHGSDPMLVFLNNGDGTFAQPASYSGQSGSRFALGDVNADGWLDVVSIYSSAGLEGITISYNDHHGGFPNAIFWHASGRVNDVALADIDGSPGAEIITSQLHNNVVTVMHSATSHTDYPVGAAPQRIAVADFDGDGQVDVATVNSGDQTISILRNLGGTFAPKVSIPDNSQIGFAIAPADFNNDGVMDFAIGHGIGRAVSIFLGTGNLQYQASPYGLSDAISCDQILVGDLNSDGATDLVYQNGTSQDTVGVALANGDGTFLVPKEYSTMAGARQVRLGDLDHDGLLDAVVLTVESSTLTILRNTGARTFAPMTSMHTGGSAMFKLADLNADGNLDIFVNDSENGLAIASVFLGHGDATFGAPIDLGVLDIYESLNGLELGDVDNDGGTDIVTLIQGNLGQSRIEIFHGAPNGPLTINTYPVTNGAGGLVLADFDGDNDLDVAILAYNTIEVLFNQGGAFGPGVDYPSVYFGFSPVGADIDGDGDIDLAFLGAHEGSTEDNVYVWLNAGNGTFSQNAMYRVRDDSTSLAVQDIDGDAKPDLIVGQTYDDSYTLGVFLNQGSGVFGTRLDYNGNINPGALDLGDIDNDGRIDVAVANDYNGGMPWISILWGRCL